MFSYGSNSSAPQPPRPTTPPASVEERREAVAERMSRELLAGRSPRQRELANTIFERLRGGAEIEDIEHLIKDIEHTAVDDYRRRGRAGY